MQTKKNFLPLDKALNYNIKIVIETASADIQISHRALSWFNVGMEWLESLYFRAAISGFSFNECTEEK
jgi:hypothetical protein